MSVKKYLLIGLLCFVSPCLIAQTPVQFPNPAHLSHEINQKDLRTHVTFLSLDALGGRLTGSDGEKLAAEYIANVFQYLGLEPAGDKGTYFQDFNFSTGHQQQQGRNVLARLRVDSKSKQVLLVGAHLDHLGYGIGGSLAREEEQGLVHSGADDNASGVASLLEAAVQLTEIQKQGQLHGQKDILFAAWSGEEIGILGSSHFIKNYSSNDNQPKIVADINLDMVGRLQDKLILQGIGSSSLWPQLLEQANANSSLALILQTDPYLPTDSTAFYVQGIPSINFFTGAHAEYHSPRDKPETLNYAGMEKITGFLVHLILEIENHSGFIDYKEVVQTTSHEGRGVKVYLGTIPDYAGLEVNGLGLAGVTKGSPAEQAGLKSKDVVVELAGKKIHDIYGYTSALNALSVGEPVKIVVLRGNDRVVLHIVPKTRSGK